MSRLQEGQMNTNLKRYISQENCPYVFTSDSLYSSSSAVLSVIRFFLAPETHAKMYNVMSMFLFSRSL